MPRQFYQFFSRTLAAGAIAEVHAEHRFLTILTNDTNTDVRLSVGNQPEQAFPEGLSLELPQSDRVNIVRLRNTSGGNMTIEFTLSNGRIFDNRATISSTDLEALRQQEEGDTTPAEAGTSAQITDAVNGEVVLAANSNRNLFHLFANRANTDEIFIYFDGSGDGSTEFAFSLNPGDFYSNSRYRGIVRAQAAVNNERLHWAEFNENPS